MALILPYLPLMGKRIIAALLVVAFCSVVHGQEARQYIDNPKLVIEDADKSFAAGQYQKAVTLYQLYSALTLSDDPSVIALIEKCKRCLDMEEKVVEAANRSDFDLAFSYWEQLLEINPSQKANIGEFEVFTKGHEWVDLGLPSRLMWATCNVGASSPSETGLYFSWGETSLRGYLTWENYAFTSEGDSKESVVFSKYNTKSERGTVDNRTRLEMSDDAARVNWGGVWRMPTSKEYRELMDNCSHSFTICDGKNGLLLTSKINGNSLFLPAAGFHWNIWHYNADEKGYYWSSSLDSNNPENGCCLFFSISDLYVGLFNRYQGLFIRPVF